MTDAAQAAADRVDRLLEQLRCGPDPRAAVVADELVRCLVQLYGDGLTRIMEFVGPELGARLCADPLVESLLLVHDLHPADADTRIRQALERARPRLGDVDYLGIDSAGVVRVRLTAGGQGCQAQTVRQLLEAVVQQAAPETAAVDVEVPAPAPPLLQVSLRPGIGRPSIPARPTPSPPFVSAEPGG
jgi:Fe-S cluster biogenesis protein NfuA